MGIEIFVPKNFVDGGIYHRDRNEETIPTMVSEHDVVAGPPLHKDRAVRRQLRWPGRGSRQAERSEQSGNEVGRLGLVWLCLHAVMEVMTVRSSLYIYIVKKNVLLYCRKKNVA